MTKLVILTKQGQIGKKKLAVRTELTRSICGEVIKHVKYPMEQCSTPKIHLFGQIKCFINVPEAFTRTYPYLFRAQFPTTLKHFSLVDIDEFC